MQDSHVKFWEEVRISDTLSGLLINLSSAQAKFSIEYNQNSLEIMLQLMMSLICHDHIGEFHLIIEGFEAELVVIFETYLPNLNTIYLHK